MASSSSSPEITPATRVDSQQQFSYKTATYDEVMDDLSSRFILNLPDEELASVERICFQVEQAHWFYEDFIREENPTFPSLPLRKFSAMLFHSCPLLHQWRHEHEQAFNQFLQYKIRVPVCGAIMLNDTWEKCVLVKGWKSSSGWGFPKGKINEDESPPNCAIREVLEETGYNLADQLDPEHVIEMTIKEQKISLYIVPGVPEDYPFKTKTRKEISKIEWFRLTDLPTWKRNKGVPGKFYLISPFIGPLKAFIKEHKPRSSPHKSPARARKNGQTSKQEPYLTETDLGQESSGQTSSGDNADPQTPSPQRLESFVSTMPTTSAEPTLEFGQSVDPHVARLLSSLTKSVTGSTDNEIAIVSTPANQIQHHNGIISDTDTTAGTKQTPQAPTKHVSAGAMDVSSTAVHHSTPSRPRTTQPPLTLSLPPRTQTEFTKASPASPCSSKTPISPVGPGASPKTSRRTASTADISPYLSRPVEPPTSAKRLKQLALLEAVADESARMTPLLIHRDANLATLNLNDKPYPLPPLPRNHPGGPGILYSSRIPSGPVARPPPISPFMDLMQARAQTSLGYRNPIHHSGSASMNQSQLQALIDGRTATPQGPAYSTPFRGHQMAPYPSFYSPGISGVPPQPASQPPVNAYHLHPTPPFNAFNPTPSTLPQGFQALTRPAPQAQANSLLSILSGSRPLPNGAAGTIFPNGHM